MACGIRGIVNLDHFQLVYVDITVAHANLDRRFAHLVSYPTLPHLETIQ
ncbi:hypothetical protein RMSM_02867 [Rhodopirellula maiorica SM1]|uniref:Uncharacterized protein n=1 Tax=Rhodopirellula maiorica SM1 TaxID=1265738 RepID=M5RLK7_9BACT|nr:hypothetical protein RMSM_02867 [Rhodopirellula maiorica SM1]